MTIEALRTPEDRFAILPNFPYAPNYLEHLPGYEGLRMHFIDEGNPNGNETFLCLHGQPTWSYLYRKMIPVFAGTGGRVVVPDWFGFGRSDKPANDGEISFSFHRNSIIRFIEALDLKNITLVCQDWGGILGLTLPMEMQERISRLFVMNTCLPTGKSLGEGWETWKQYARNYPDLAISGLMSVSCPGVLDWMDIAAYEAPFPDARYKAAVRRFPELVPVEEGMEGVNYCKKARIFLRDAWEGESFMAIGLADPVLTRPIMDELRKQIAGCPAPLLLEHAGHFVQEWGEDVALAALRSFGLAT